MLFLLFQLQISEDVKIWKLAKKGNLSESQWKIIMYGEGELKTVSEGWVKTVDISTTDNPNITWTMEDDDHVCKLVLYKEIQDSRSAPDFLFLYQI